MYANMCYTKVSGLYSPTSVLILAHSKILIGMGIAFLIPMGYYGWIAPRSGLAIHHHIHVGAGVVDPDYTGSVHMLLMNLGSQDHVIEKNYRIAQMIPEKVAYPIICEVPQMLSTEHGANGFGSTGQWRYQEGRNLIGPSQATNHDNDIVNQICQCPLDNVFANKCVLQ